ncbi:MAG: ComF family protein [Clostridia bacterium]|nr:ComF family protein [Clostridia bacterium]
MKKTEHNNLFFRIAKATYNTVLDTLFPKCCIMCGRLLPANCEFCVCHRCKPEMKNQSHVIVDNNCGCEEIISPFTYDGNVRQAMLKFKFKGIEYIGYTFAKAIADMLYGRRFVEEDCVLVSVPIHISRDRDYNQSDVIARQVSELTGLPYHSDVVYKIKPISRISGMLRRDKKFFVQGSFHFNSCYNLTGKTVIIVDDIYTSGSTLKVFADELKMHGAHKVYALTACVTEAQ